jgi:hypothetical protein
MKIQKDSYGDEPVRGELGLLLLLVAFSSIGLLMWVGILFAIHWSVLTAWTASAGA